MVREHTDAYSGARIALRRKNSIVFLRNGAPLNLSPDL